MIPTIIAIVGASGSGKTTLVNHIQKTLGIPALVSYTTRPIRPGETDGVEHWFVTEDTMPSRDKMLAYTKFGDYHYWTKLSQLETQEICMYIIDEKGLLELQALQNDFFNHKSGSFFHLIEILVERDENLIRKNVDEQRMQRDNSRISLPREFYQITLKNNGTLEDFLNTSVQIFQTLI